MTEASARHGLTVRAARVVPAPPPAVWHALTDAETMHQWWGKTEKADLFACEIEPRAGGRFRLGTRLPKGDDRVFSGTYREWGAPRRLAFTWSEEDATARVQGTAVTIDLFDLKDGSTRVVVTHEGLPTPTSASTHSAGWHDLLQDITLHFAAA